MSKTEDKTKSKPAKKNALQGMNIAKLANMRIIQKHLVYVIGLSSNLASKEVLGKHEYFGQYGTILKIVVNKTKAYNPNGPKGPSYSAYISYSTDEEASIAILAIDNIEVDDHILRASYGTTKYCTFFLKNLDCPNKDCLYLHHLANENDIINRDDMNSNTNVFYEQQLLAMKLADIFNSEVKKKLKNINPKKKCVFPTTDTIFTKDIVLDQDDEYKGYNYYDKDATGNSHYKFKKKYNNDYYGGYSGSYHNENDNFYECDNFDNDDDPNMLYREKSENLNKPKSFGNCKKTNKFKDIDTSETSCNKFISKSKSPITSKKKVNESKEDNSITTKISINSVSPSNKIRDEIFIESNKNSNVLNENENNKNLNNNKVSAFQKKKLYRKHDESRFSFAKSQNENYKLNVIKENKGETEMKKDDDLVPDYVSDVICKKISRHSFFKKFEKFFEKDYNDYEFFEKHLKQNDSWSNFIISNMNIGNSCQLK